MICPESNRAVSWVMPSESVSNFKERMISDNFHAIILVMEKKRVLREFEWFEVQTKVRELISEILHPLEKKVGAQGTSLVKVQEATREEHNRLDQITMMINKDENIFETGILHSVEMRFREQAVLI